MLTHKSRKILLIAVMALFALVASAAFLRANAGEQGAAPAAAPAPDPQYAKMQEQMKLMQSQMDKLANTRDPKERERLLQEHMAAMQGMMATMHGARGGTMGGNAACGRMMPMHQMMLDQMMQHQKAMMQPMMQPAPTSPPAAK